MSRQVFEGIRVLDLSQFLSGPRCSQLLALKGAEVVKIEPPQGETMRLLTGFMRSERMMSALHQNKKGMALDLKKDAGRDLFLKLVEKADIVIENFAPGLMKKLGLDYDTLVKVNPRIIYVAISGFGRTGPHSDRTAFDIISQASAGIMHAYKMPDKPPKVYFGDLVSGAYAALGAVEALYDREKTGKGQLVDISMQDVMYFQNFSCFSDNALKPVAAEIEKLLGRSLSNLLTDDKHPLPFWSSFRAKDGYVVIVALTDREWRHFMEVTGRPELADDARFCNFLTRIQNADEGVKIVSEWISAQTVESIVAALEEKHVPCAAVADFEMVNTSPQLEARGMLAKVTDEKLGEIAVPGDPITLSDSEQDIRTSCPGLGEHTAEVLSSWLGMPDDEIQALRKSRIVFTAR